MFHEINAWIVSKSSNREQPASQTITKIQKPKGNSLRSPNVAPTLTFYYYNLIIYKNMHTFGANDGKWLGGTNGVGPPRPGCNKLGL